MPEQLSHNAYRHVLCGVFKGHAHVNVHSQTCSKPPVNTHAHMHTHTHTHTHTHKQNYLISFRCDTIDKDMGIKQVTSQLIYNNLQPNGNPPAECNCLICKGEPHSLSKIPLPN